MTDGRAGLLQHVGRRHLAEALGDDEVLRVRGLDADHLEVVVVVEIRRLTLVGELEEEVDRRTRWRIGGGGGGNLALVADALDRLGEQHLHCDGGEGDTGRGCGDEREAAARRWRRMRPM